MMAKEMASQEETVLYPHIDQDPQVVAAKQESLRIKGMQSNSQIVK